GNFMRDYDVAPQEILPLLTRSGAEFERRVEEEASRRFRLRNLARERADAGREHDDAEVAAAARDLPPGQTLILLQTRLQVALDGWDMTGDADIVRLERDACGRLGILVADMKATTTAKVEHRLQVAFYREMLERIFDAAGVGHEEIAIGILYRGAPAFDEEADPEERERLDAQRTEAARLFAVDDALLELTPDPAAYRDAVRGLVTGPASVAAQVAAAPFAAIPWHLTYKCDGCIYNEFCMKWAAEHDDLSLLPHLTEHEKRGLHQAGIETTRELTELLVPETDPETGQPDLRHLAPAPGKREVVQRIAGTWPVGPRLDELVHRARRYRNWQGDDIRYFPYIPSKGYGSLPYSDAKQNPNLVRVFIDAQHDYLDDRLYLLGSLVVGNEAGAPSADRRQSIVKMADGPPDEEAERSLLIAWIEATIRAIATVAAPDEEGGPTAPIHLIFFNGFEQRLLLQALSRHARQILAATPLYDFITQLAAFDSPVATFLDQEIRELKNYPIVCQPLQAVAAMARPGGEWFDWNAGAPYREIFRERLFDSLGRFDALPHDGEKAPWSTRRSRFNSQIPLEYAYAAWGALAAPEVGKKDSYAPYRRATVPLIERFQARRLEAMEHISRDFAGNRDTTKSNFVIPDLAHFDGKAQGLAEALQEFVTIERHVELAAWKAARLAPPERRVLAGDTLIVRYLAADQLPGVAETIAENLRRVEVREAQRAAYFAEHPNARQARLTKEQKALSDPLPITAPIRLRIDISDCDVSLDDALSLTTIKAGDYVVLEPRWGVDGRLPVAEQTPITPTPKQLLYGMRQTILEIETVKDGSGRIVEAWLHTSPAQSRSSDNPPGFLFPGFDEALIDGKVYTIDPDPNDIYGFWGAKVVQGLLAGGRNELFERVRLQGQGDVAWPEAARQGQARFMAGLRAMHEAGATYGFEPSKVAFIGSHGDAPLLLVQGPPGTGKSFTTAYAILARLQGALAAGMPFRVLVGAKTHAATNVLLENVVGAMQELERMQAARPAIFADYFDPRVLAVPLYRLQGREAPPEGVTPIFAKGRRPKEQPKSFDLLAGAGYVIVASTPGGVYSAADEMSGLFGREVVDLLVLDEASQLSLPESIMAALPLKRDGQVVIVGDHRQMAPIVKHDWESETRRTFQDYAVYRSLFDSVLGCHPVMIQFEQSFRLDRDMAEFLRHAIYARDGIAYHSQRCGRIRFDGHQDAFVAAALDPAHPLVVIVHDEASSQLRNDVERDLTLPLIAALHEAGYRVDDGFGLVVPHRAQRASLQEALRQGLPDPAEQEAVARAVDTVERFQGDERDAIIVSATESDPAYLLAAGKFLYDPRRLTVAISRAKDKMILVASRSVFDLFSPDEETFDNAQLWKDLLYRTCTVPLWAGEIDGRRVEVWGNPPLAGAVPDLSPGG
ncbi:MAG: AAA family ATPase, partial [Thermomicrobiales bacterium]|nr:AAA family ATPase [Thermomicrobiales bacterium]